MSRETEGRLFDEKAPEGTTGAVAPEGKGVPRMASAVRNPMKLMPQSPLVDGGFAGKESVEAATDRQVTVCAPAQKPTREGVDPHQPKPADSEALGIGLLIAITRDVLRHVLPPLSTRVTNPLT